MARFIKDRTLSRGQMPGSLILIGNQKMEKPVIQLMEFDQDQLKETVLESIEETHACKDTEPVSWINIWGIHDLQMMQRLGEIFDIHHLFMEDILNTDQRPKYVDGENYDAFILKMLQYDGDKNMVSAEQCTLILGKNYVLTLQEQPGDVFNSVRERIRNTKKRLRLKDPDYLAYALMDTIVDNYIYLIETLGRKIESMEERLFGLYDKQIGNDIHTLKTELTFLRKSVRPVREMITRVVKSETSFFQEKYLQYLHDLDDLVEQATDAIELYNGLLSDYLNIYSTNVNNRTNEVMKVLTIFASIFIPLSFLAGVYGMNFNYIPELGFRYSYFIFWGVVVSIIAGLLIYFRRKKWL